MQINNTEINGFEIETFNQYDLPVGKKEAPCPMCSKDRKPENQKKKVLLMDWEKGLGTCMHCGVKLQLHTFTRKTEKTYIKPKTNENRNIDDKVVGWFNSRGISKDTLVRAGVTTRPGWVEFNYWENGQLINRKSRNGKKQFLLEKGAEKIFYNVDGIRNTDWCIIVEGEIDALTCIESGFNNVVSVPNGATAGNNNLDYLDSCIDYFNGKTKIILALDKDEAGQALEAEFIRRFGSEVCYVCEFGGFKDLNEVLIDRGVDYVRGCIDSATPLPLEGVTMIKDMSNEMDEFFKTGGPSGFKAGIEGLDDIFSVLPGQYCVVTAVPTAGKTFFVDQYALGLNKLHGWKVGMCSVESKPDWIAGTNLVRKLYEEFPQDTDIGSNKYHKIKEHLNDNFFFIDMDSYSLDAVLRKATELVKRKGIKMLVLDPINRIRGREKASVGEYTIEYFSKIDEWCKRHQVFAMVVAHPHKITKLENGEWPEMSYYNIAGGADIANMAYHILAMNRSYVEDQTTIKVLKCKFNFLGKNGESAKFKYNVKSTNFEYIDESFKVNDKGGEDLPF